MRFLKNSSSTTYLLKTLKVGNKTHREISLLLIQGDYTMLAAFDGKIGIYKKCYACGQNSICNCCLSLLQETFAQEHTQLKCVSCVTHSMSHMAKLSIDI